MTDHAKEEMQEALRMLQNIDPIAVSTEFFPALDVVCGELRRLQAQVEQLTPMAKFGRDVLDLHEVDAMGDIIEEFAFRRGLLTPSETREQSMDETPLAKLPDDIK